MSEPSTSKSGVCGSCGVLVAELRRGRCFWCYTSWVRSRPVGLGAHCAACGDRRREDLRHLDLGRLWVILCHTCCAQAERIKPRPVSREALFQRLSRDRRWTERRWLAIEVGSEKDRRSPGDRRLPRATAALEPESTARLLDAASGPPTAWPNLGFAEMEEEPASHGLDETRVAAFVESLAGTTLVDRASPLARAHGIGAEDLPDDALDDVVDASDLVVEMEAEEPYGDPLTTLHEHLPAAFPDF